MPSGELKLGDNDDDLDIDVEFEIDVEGGDDKDDDLSSHERHRPATPDDNRPTPAVRDNPTPVLQDLAEPVDPDKPTRIPSDMEGIAQRAFAETEDLQASLKPPPLISEYRDGQSMPPGATISDSSGHAHPPSHITPVAPDDSEPPETPTIEQLSVDGVLGETLDRYLEVAQESRDIAELISSDSDFRKLAEMRLLLRDVDIDIDGILTDVDSFRFAHPLAKQEILDICMLLVRDVAVAIQAELNGENVQSELMGFAAARVAVLYAAGGQDNPFLLMNLNSVIDWSDRYLAKSRIEQNIEDLYGILLKKLSG